MRPDEGVIIEETNCVAVSHMEGSTTLQRWERKKYGANGESLVAAIRPGFSMADWDRGTNREPCASPPETVHASLVKEDARAVTRSAATDHAVDGQVKETEELHGQGERQLDKQVTSGIGVKRAAIVTTAQKPSAAGLGVPVARHPMLKGNSQEAIFRAWWAESPSKDRKTTDDIISNASSYRSVKACL